MIHVSRRPPFFLHLLCLLACVCLVLVWSAMRWIKGQAREERMRVGNSCRADGWVTYRDDSVLRCSDSIDQRCLLRTVMGHEKRGRTICLNSPETFHHQHGSIRGLDDVAFTLPTAESQRCSRFSASLSLTTSRTQLPHVEWVYPWRFLQLCFKGGRILCWRHPNPSHHRLKETAATSRQTGQEMLGVALQVHVCRPLPARPDETMVISL